MSNPILTMREVQVLYEHLLFGYESTPNDPSLEDLAQELGLLSHTLTVTMQGVPQLVFTQRGQVFMHVMRQHISVKQRYTKLLLLGLPVIND